MREFAVIIKSERLYFTIFIFIHLHLMLDYIHSCFEDAFIFDGLAYCDFTSACPFAFRWMCTRYLPSWIVVCRVIELTLCLRHFGREIKLLIVHIDRGLIRWIVNGLLSAFIVLLLFLSARICFACVHRCRCRGSRWLWLIQMLLRWNLFDLLWSCLCWRQVVGGW